MRVESARTRRNLVVIDTNVWLSAWLSPHGVPAQVVDRVLAFGTPVFSEATFDELETRVWKPKFDRYLTMEMRKGVLHDARAYAHWVDVSNATSTKLFCRDADDDKFIHVALESSASWLVTGDQDLLVINVDTGVRILAPADALLTKEFCQ